MVVPVHMHSVSFVGLVACAGGKLLLVRDGVVHAWVADYIAVVYLVNCC